ncbi:MAG: TonB-dependent receptor [Bacteroidota bacterium]
MHPTKSILSLLTLLLSLNVLSGQDLLNTPVTIQVEQASIPECLDLISQQVEVKMAYSSRFFAEAGLVELKVKERPLAEVLDRLLAATGMGYRLAGTQLIIFKQKKRKPPSYTISGYLEDEATGEKLVAATVVCQRHNRGAVTNEYGFYSLTLPAGAVELSYSYLGCTPSIKAFDLQQNHRINMTLEPATYLSEVIVRPEESNSDALLDPASGQHIPGGHLALLPDLAGENDVVRVAQQLPGVQTGADGSGGMYVRGGGGGQNLILLDGVPIYNPSHLLGLFSIFNSSAIRSARLLKGSFPARYGGRLSSVLDVRTREGNLKHWEAEAGVGLLSGRASVEGPIVEDKVSLLVAGRHTLSNYLLGSSIATAFVGGEPDELDLRFYDLNAKLNYSMSNKDRLMLSYYNGADAFYGFLEDEETLQRSESSLDWGNQMAALRWNHEFGDRLFSNTTLTYSNYNFDNSSLYDDLEEEVFEYYEFSSNVEDIAFKIDVDYLPSPKHSLRFGMGLSRQEYLFKFVNLDDALFELGIIDTVNIEELSNLEEKDRLENTEAFAYVEDVIQLRPNWQLNAGLRLSSTFSSGNSFWRLEPRLSTHYRFEKPFSVNASVGRMVQHLHLISAVGLRMPSDIWLPSGFDLQPSESWQLELGGQYALADGIDFSLQGYYKWMDNLYLSTELPNSSNEEIAQGIVEGNGEAYGLEFMVQKREGRSGGWLSYTLARSDRQFDEVNTGLRYAFQYDSRHFVKLFIYQKLWQRMQLSLNWTYASPNPLLLIEDESLNLGTIPIEQEPGRKNTFRDQALHRLDLGLNYLLQTGQFHHTFKLGIYNVYDQDNALFHRQFDEESFDSVFLMPFLPFIYYNIRL